jgi:5-methylcytosine-specific restriction protein A
MFRHVFDLDRELESIGKAVFVQCFEIIRLNFLVYNRHRLGELMQNEIDQKWGGATAKAYHRQASYAKRIFQVGLQYQALELCVKSPRLTDEIKYLAQSYLDEADRYVDIVQESDPLMESNQFQETINSLKQVELEENTSLEFVPIKIPKKSASVIQRVYRNPRIAKEALIKAEYKCTLDQSHQTFIHKSSGNAYMEAHHLIPLQVQHRFEYSLDVPSNVVSLCPNCHRKVHYAHTSIQKESLAYLFKTHQADLKQQGLEVPLDTLLNYYG